MPLVDLILKYRKTAVTLAGAGTALAFATYPIFPALLLVGTLLVAIHGETKPLKAAGLCFLYALAMFVVGLYWVQNAIAVSMGAPDYVRVVVFFGLPLLLVPLWMLAGWLSVRLTNPASHARSILFVTLLAAAEYGRAYLFSGFPWNLFAGAWANVNALMQVSAIGGVFFLNALTLLWAFTPAIAWLARADKKFTRGVLAFSIGSLVLCLAYGTMRLSQNPTVLREDSGYVVLQPNIPQNEKWDVKKIEDNFKKHISLSEQGLKNATAGLPSTLKTVTVIWPETSLIEDLVFEQPEVMEMLLRVMRQEKGFETYIMTGLMRMTEPDKDGNRDLYNSIALLGDDDGLSMDDLYDKAHLVPFGEYIPIVGDLGYRPVTGFANFLPGGYGPKVLHAPALPPAAAIVCFEAIFPWAIDAYDPRGNAEWIINVSNDGWYGDTMGPRQHLAMTRLRAIEQGLPILRSTTTGISAVIDAYGREVSRINYGDEGTLVGMLPKMSDSVPLYRSVREAIFYLLVGTGLALSFFFRKKNL